jgi:hypothetical protein
MLHAKLDERLATNDDVVVCFAAIASYGSWLTSHGRSLVKYHLHQETKFWDGEYDQRDHAAAACRP